jgi:hypothetical protein
MALSTTRLAFLLSETPMFRSRVQMALLNIANVILTEPAATANHAARVAYAKAILNSPTQMASIAAPFVTQNAVIFPTISMEDEGPRTTVTDNVLIQQMTLDWSKMAGIDLGV